MAEQQTSLPIRDSLISDTHSLASELDMSWERLVTLALTEFVQKHKGRKQLVNGLNEAYAEGLDDDEKRIKVGMRNTQRMLAEGEW